MSMNYECVEIAGRAELRQWLEANAGQADSVWLVTWKKGDARYVPYTEIVDEALCFGWVDSLPRKLDGARTMLLLSPRRAGSAWSKVNKEKAERLIREGLMRPRGLTKIEEAKLSGDWDKLESVDALEAPEDLLASLRVQPDAERNWDAFPKSVRRGILEWIIQAKRPETRANRIAETSRLAARGERANQWRPKSVRSEEGER
jgi:uncharacterized protein YdeI (YjbR/CyaY-like superfamily)